MHNNGQHALRAVLILRKTSSGFLHEKAYPKLSKEKYNATMYMPNQTLVLLLYTNIYYCLLLIFPDFLQILPQLYKSFKISLE